MKSHYIFFTFIILTIQSLYCKLDAQNLVLNGSFEEFGSCPQNPTDQRGWTFIQADNWTIPTRGTPDYFNACSINMGVPNNMFGLQDAKSGSAYAGMYVQQKISGTKNNYREYLQGKLSSKLEKNRKYLVSFYVSLADLSDLAIANMGLKFTNSIQSDRTTDMNLKLTPDVASSDTVFLNNSTEWKRVSTIYSANGTETYFVIGNFRNDITVLDIAVPPRKPKSWDTQGIEEMAYYYIDEVSVIPLHYKYEEICKDSTLMLRQTIGSSDEDIKWYRKNNPSEVLSNKDEIELKITSSDTIYAVVKYTNNTLRNRVDTFKHFISSVECLSHEVLTEKKPPIESPTISQQVQDQEPVWTNTDIFIPNVFSPNNDGYNDKLNITLNSYEDYQVYVYNRWGKLVFRSNHPEKIWDGRNIVTNEDCTSGVYFLIIKYVDKEKPKQYKGSVTLIR